jgi:hypothetical protein
MSVRHGEGLNSTLHYQFPLLKEAYNETKLLYLSKKPTWYELINIIVNILKTTNTDINLLLRKKNTWKILISKVTTVVSSNNIDSRSSSYFEHSNKICNSSSIIFEEHFVHTLLCRGTP